MTEWEPFDTAPADGTRVMLCGYWNAKASSHVRGLPFMCVASYTTLSAKGDHKQWFVETGFLGPTPFDSFAVTFTHWSKLPEPAYQKHPL